MAERFRPRTASWQRTLERKTASGALAHQAAHSPENDFSVFNNERELAA
jgi:hypothetical protein